jgi:hypothetical protein
MNRFEERQKQVELAEAKGSLHIHDPKDILLVEEQATE